MDYETTELKNSCFLNAKNPISRVRVEKNGPDCGVRVLLGERARRRRTSSSRVNAMLPTATFSMCFVISRADGQLDAV